MDGKQYISPSELRMLDEFIDHLRTRDMTHGLSGEVQAYARLLDQEGVISIYQVPSSMLISLEKFRANVYTDQDILDDLAKQAEKMPVVPETFATVASSVRKYIHENAGSIPVLQLLYNVYQRDDVQRVCKNNLWLMDNQIVIGLQSYIAQHRDEAEEFINRNPKQPSDF